MVGITYSSTRGGDQHLGFRETVMRGLASDGGLFVPDEIPVIDAATLAEWSKLDFGLLAVQVIKRFVHPDNDKLDDATLTELVERSFGTSFTSPKVTPLVEASEDGALSVLELFHGPTFAFKDVALQFLGNLFEHFLTTTPGARPITVLGATSGDTGSAAIYGLRGRKNVQVFILYPTGKVAHVQEKQMTTVDDPNVHCISVAGTFDDCQDIVKELFNNPVFREKHNLAAINSINWARILAQIVYYFSAYFQLQAAHPERAGSKVVFSVPTGNFGDVLAGYYAKRMGLPIHKLIVATNANDILHRFFATGDYSRKNVVETYAPSMDIQVSSNFERYLFYLAGQDPRQVGAWMAQLRDNGKIEISPSLVQIAQGDFDSCAVGQSEIIDIIQRTASARKYILCPHSATSYAASLHYLEKVADRSSTSVISLATAHPAKFSDTVKQATGALPAFPAALEAILDKPTSFVTSPATAASIAAILDDHWRAQMRQGLETSTHELFEKYCGLTDKTELRAIATRVQKQALEVFPYRCIQEMRFMLPRMRFLPYYNRILENVANKKVLDIGCCMGTDLRQLIVDGANPSNLVGVDVADGFFALGRELFNDASRTPAPTFVTANVMEPSERSRLPFNQFDVVYAGSLLHLLDEATVVTMIQAAFALARPGGVFVGRNVGRLNAPGMFPRRSTPANAPEQLRYLHTADTLKQALLAAGFSKAEVVSGRESMLDLHSERERDEMCFLSFCAER
ncbi:threonine synthase [Capsaspora owczarzaki ATCC 30864]|uniref:threonine synthase n=1 Tax=Capsaspora owczarzaki (strain ATCC 30864) TaxID=595528 RepID=A0A0D2X4H6_CAPO3|nr:threonine synthase [Capsaspora owczarzaki ATCC 30864]KJE96074.1 threonine synthase [Capsaspora owczarzaki ATCC 30864]|eukprot:XP_004345195.1 threonine synthase [Capsaspora owczarzaki ATCC 30864]